MGFGGEVCLGPNKGMGEVELRVVGKGLVDVTAGFGMV